MENKKLLKTNLMISSILLVGFILTAVLSYRANYQASVDSMEQISSLTADGIYYQIRESFTKPVNISLTMAHDSLLASHLMEEPEDPKDQDYIETTKYYLENYREKYGFNSVFLVSTATGRYYNFNGLDRVLLPGVAENEWYFDLINNQEEYSLNVDNDEVAGADNVITVFVNCKVWKPDGTLAGVVGVGIRVDDLKELLRGYEDNYNIRASLVNTEGMIGVSTSHTGYEKLDWFQTYDKEAIRNQVLGWRMSDSNLELWTDGSAADGSKSYVVSRYIPEVAWSLVVEQDTGHVLQEMKQQLYRTAVILVLVVVTVLLVITAVIRNFNRQLMHMAEERQTIFKKATEQLYESIYELNLTRNCYVGKRTEDYFASQGAGGMPFDQGLAVIAQKQIKEEYREGYLKTFGPENAIREYKAGKNHLQYDFMLRRDMKDDYHWIRVDAYLFYSEEDQSIHMFAYRKNIDREKRQELRAATDEMTGFLTKKATERAVDMILEKEPGKMYAFFILDIDNFKQVNDRFGHAFGDGCICGFTRAVRSHFRDDDILGRLGGDEFAVFIQVPGEAWVRRKAEELSHDLDMNLELPEGAESCRISASIGVAIAPRDGTSFVELYRHGDAALYETKRRGKNGFTLWAGSPKEDSGPR